MVEEIPQLGESGLAHDQNIDSLWFKGWDFPAEGFQFPFHPLKNPVVNQAQSSQVLKSSGKIAFMGEVAVLNPLKLVILDGENSFFREYSQGFRWQIGSKVGELLGAQFFIQERRGPGRLQDPIQSRLEEILHDDLIPVGPAHSTGRLISERVDPAWAMKTFSATQAIIGEGAKG